MSYPRRGVRAIRLATALGIVVVEAGGNGTNNGFLRALAMDTFVDPMGRRIFDPMRPDFRDSGAIVTVATWMTPPYAPAVDITRHAHQLLRLRREYRHMLLEQRQCHEPLHDHVRGHVGRLADRDRCRAERKV